MNKTIYIRRNYYYYRELYGVSILFKFSTIDDMTLYVTAQLQKQTAHPRIICRGHYIHTHTDVFTWFFKNIQGWLSLPIGRSNRDRVSASTYMLQPNNICVTSVPQKSTMEWQQLEHALECLILNFNKAAKTFAWTLKRPCAR